FGCLIRLIGDEGVLELLFDKPWLRMRRWAEPAWQSFDEGESIHDNAAINRGVAEMLDCLESGKLPLLASERALRPTEIIFATRESSRRRARIDLPLPPCKCAMLEMLESGELTAEIEDVKL